MDKKLKIALVFYGQPRISNIESYNSIKEKLLDIYDCDVYIHTWWSKEDYLNNISYIKSPWSQAKDLQVKDNIDEILKEMYNPKVLKCEKIKDFMEVSDILKRVPNAYNNISQMYTINEASKLIENYEQYDFIIKLRLDIVLYKIPKLEELNMDKTHVIDTHVGREVFNDNIWILSIKHIKLFNMFDKKDQYYEEIGTLNIEGILCHHAKKIGIYKDIIKVPEKDFTINRF
jgi:hypothetical protein